jgi:hypothetical protein
MTDLTQLRVPHVRIFGRGSSLRHGLQGRHVTSKAFTSASTTSGKTIA